MSARQITTLTVVGIIAFSAGAGTAWTVLRPGAAQTGAGIGSKPVADRQSHREKFFSGDPDRNVRGGQELKPRW